MSPVRGLETVVRIPRTFNIRLGVRLKKIQGSTERPRLRITEEGGYPQEVEYFVLAPEEVPEEIRKLYGEEPKSLELMLLTEYDHVDENGNELTLNLNNRAWRRRGLRCFGHGRSADEVDWAYTNDPEWSARIGQATKIAPELVTGEERKKAPLPGDKVWRVPCLGQDCVKYSRLVEGMKDGQKAMVPAEGHDADSGCKANICLRAFLLHPNFGRAGKEGEREVLAAIQIASGSYNSIVQLRSGFKLMKPFTGGRTAGIPFTLVRKPTTTFTPMRQIHWTLDILQTPSRWQRYAVIPMNKMFLSEEEYEYARQLASTPLGLEFEAVKDLYAAPKQLTTGQREDANLPPAGERGGSEAQSEQGDQSGGAGQAPVDSASPDPEGGVLLTRSQVDELRRAFGTRRDPEGPEDDNQNPYPPEVLAKLVGAVALYDKQHDTKTSKFSELTRAHYDFIMRIAKGQP